MTPVEFDAYSLVMIYSALVVYAIAFIAFAIDLSGRSMVTAAAAPEASAGESRAGRAAAEGSTTNVGVVERADVSTRSANKFARVGISLTALAWVLHIGSIVLRGVADGHVPWSNMYEFSMVGTGVMAGVFLALNFKLDLKFLGTFVTGLVVLLLGVATVNFYVSVVPLPVALQSPWLVIHVAVATLGTGFFAIGSGLSVAQLLSMSHRHKPEGTGFLTRLPSAERLESLAYRVIVIGFVLWTFTLIAGAIWAEHAWGRYWGWDTKEVWTFIIWTLFAGYIHARATRGWRGSRSAWLAIVGFAAVLFNFSVVNLFFAGWHSYSGL